MTEAVKNPGAKFDGDVVDPAESWGWLGDHSDRFDKGVEKLKEELDKAFKALAGDENGVGGDPTNPAHLANYQTALSGYTTYRTLQSNSAKSLSDMQKQNARNLG
ncbi:EscF/YscF/HrpA family type III secretion system needle major subunit [uncultured Stenotrophomonas sp.]|uniref:EscF/YscF/HrpA family type III secretion system needle major subunit n=1 Tax=uncultured Stenotrophomonas sp. TaxID=165438 RepID=UPI0028EA7424|nr:EscF/YscF/HrpA family type III secretion system needle major subunit [uncultured Stenotrophomonas sp.]